MTVPGVGTAFGRGSTTEALAGLVERVTFHNSDSSFCVLRVKVRGQRDLVTVVGHAATIAAGEWVQMSGTWINDRTHGLQFKAAFLKASPRCRSWRRSREGEGAFAHWLGHRTPCYVLPSPRRVKGRGHRGHHWRAAQGGRQSRIPTMRTWPAGTGVRRHPDDATLGLADRGLG
jgi:hypothetical protein